MQIEGTKRIFIMNFSVLHFFICLQNASNCTHFSGNFQNFRRGEGHASGSPKKFPLFFFSLAIQALSMRFTEAYLFCAVGIRCEGVALYGNSAHCLGAVALHQFSAVSKVRVQDSRRSQNYIDRFSLLRLHVSGHSTEEKKKKERKKKKNCVMERLKPPFWPKSISEKPIFSFRCSLLWFTKV